MSKIYSIKRTDQSGYDEYDGFVVIAKSPGQARNLCAQQAADEGKQIWLADTTELTMLAKYSIDDTPRIVLESFNAG